MNTIFQKGFTLVELSIVLVIIGLLITGILTGKSLIKTAELNKVITIIKELETASGTFRSKYNCLPGDCLNADKLGIVPDAQLPGFSANGNGTINDQNGESGLFWSELYLSGLFTNVDLSQAPTWYLSPKILRQNTFDFPGILSSATDVTYDANGIWAIFFVLEETGMETVCSDMIMCNGFSAEEAYYIDSKRDDGLPKTGLFKSIGPIALMPPEPPLILDYSDLFTNLPPSEDVAGSDACIVAGSDIYNASTTNQNACLPFFKLNF